MVGCRVAYRGWYLGGLPSKTLGYQGETLVLALVGDFGDWNNCVLPHRGDDFEIFKRPGTNPKSPIAEQTGNVASLSHQATCSRATSPSETRSITAPQLRSFPTSRS